MSFDLEIREVRAVGAGAGPSGGNPSAGSLVAEWEVEFKAGFKSLTARIRDPFRDSPALLGTTPEDTVTWYLENHINEPFETTRADAAAEVLSSYGRDLAAQIARTGLLPKKGDIQLRIVSAPSSQQPPQQVAGSGAAPGSIGRSLKQLHWEILEDVKLWPAEFRFGSVSVVRLVTGAQTADSHAVMGNTEHDSAETRSQAFRILLVVSRPTPETDVDYQLVAKCLVAVVDHVSSTNPGVRVSLKILRPPTWGAFREHLRDNHYDLVHFDMKGEIRTRKDGTVNAVLEFCKPDLRNPLKMKRDLRTAEEVGKELASAGVRIVVLNACNSASFRDSHPGTNLAEILLGHGVHSVLAMAYKVVEEAVEIFMSAFYQALLANRTSVQMATRVARSALLRTQSRRARYMHTVNLSDYIVPVLCTSAVEVDASMVQSATEPDGILGLVEKVLGSLKRVFPTHLASPSSTVDMAQRLLGRDYNILSLEVLLSVSRVVYLYGQGGVGKTELLHYVCEWWKSSGWIKGAVYIDFSSRDFYSIEDILDKIVSDLRLEMDDPTVEEVANKLRGAKYLLVFDSAEVFDTPILVDKVSRSDTLRDQLRDFIDAATARESMAIISSRLDTATIFRVPTEHHKYRLPGLSVLDSVSLLQDLTFGQDGKVPEVFYRRDNIDALRRAMILLEGNPAAIQLIVPELKKVGYSGESLHYNMLYGVCSTHLEDEGSTERCRFLRTIYVALMLPSFIDMNKTMMAGWQFAPYWNIMPKDLNFYYWFLYLSASRYFQEASIKNWISKEFGDLVHGAQMARKLRDHWPEIEKKMVSAGILTHATITRKNGDALPCYHVHPIYTLAARAAAREHQWKEMRFAFVRQALLWDPGYRTLEAVEWTSVEWDGAGPQHEDHLYNWAHLAVAWSVADGDMTEEVERMGLSMLDCTYKLVSCWAWDSPRQSRLLLPHIRAHLLQAHMNVDLFRPGSIPTPADLHAIVEYSWRLFRFEADDATQAVKYGLVKSALEIVDRWKAASPPGEAVLAPPNEVSWFQLRHAEAALAEDMAGLPVAKALYERNLMTDPVTTDAKMLNIIRRWHLQSIEGWSSCVVRLDVRDGRIDRALAQERLQGFVSEVIGSTPGSLEWWSRLMTEHWADITTIRVRDAHAYALEKESEVAATFGAFAQGILDGGILDVFSDVFPAGDMLAKLTGLMEPAQGPGGSALTESMRSAVRGFESGARMLAGDNVAAAAAVQSDIEREGLSSTTSNGWEKLAEIHMHLYTLAVPRAESPDYRKGLTHIQEWWKLHQGMGISKRDGCYGLLKLTTCFHGLGQIADAARSVIKLAETAQTLTAADCIQGDVGAAIDFLLLEIAKFDKLDVFVDPRVVFSRSAGVAELSLKERVAMNQIMVRAKQTEKDEERMHQAFDRSQKEMRKMKDLLLSVKEKTGLDGFDDLIAKFGSGSEKQVNRKPDYWLF